MKNTFRIVLEHTDGEGRVLSLQALLNESEVREAREDIITHTYLRLRRELTAARRDAMEKR